MGTYMPSFRDDAYKKIAPRIPNQPKVFNALSPAPIPHGGIGIGLALPRAGSNLDRFPDHPGSPPSWTVSSSKRRLVDGVF